MKRLQLYKSALDFAFDSINTSNPAQIDIDAAQAFQKAGFEPADYPYWKSSFEQARRQFIALSNQLTASEQAAIRKASEAKPDKA